MPRVLLVADLTEGLSQKDGLFNSGALYLPDFWRMNMTKFIKMLRDESGASAAEYALILAIVGAGIAVAAYNLGGSISNAMSKSGDCISQGTASAYC